MYLISLLIKEKKSLWILKLCYSTVLVNKVDNSFIVYTHII